MKFMITRKKRLNSHPINVVHTYLESSISYNYSGLNDEDSHLVEIEDVPKLSDCIRAVLDKVKEDFQVHQNSHRTRQRKAQKNH